MHGQLTALDVRILQALYEVGPRNLSKVARAVGISRDTLQFRIKRMQKDPQVFLRMHTSIFHTNLGLKKAVVFARAKPGMERVLFESLKANGFWIYVCRSYGMGEGCTAIYTIPIDHCSEFEEFIYETQRLGISSKVNICWSTCFEGGRITSEWFDTDREDWVFCWGDWIKEVQTQTTELPYTLIESKSYPVLADDIDVRMLVKLEKDATTDLSEIARNLGISRQLARFHFKKHLLEKGLIENYEIFAMLYRDAPFVMAFFVVQFPDHERMAKFARSLLNKFFFITMGKIHGKEAVVMEVFLPAAEFRNFIDALSELAKMKLVSNYTCAIQDLRIRNRQTISGEYFTAGSWRYDHKNHMETLQQRASGPLKS